MGNAHVFLHITCFYDDYFCLAALFCPWLEFARFFFPPSYFLFFIFYDLTCGTNAKQQDRRLWVWMLYFPKCKWLRLCVSVCECAEESSLQKRLDPHLFDGYIIFELALQLFFIHWTFFLCTSQKTHWYSLSFSWLYIGGSFFPQVCFHHCNRLLCLYHCCFILVNTSMYIPRPKHLQIQVTHGTHL